MWVIIVLMVFHGHLQASKVEDLGFETQAQCQNHIDKIKAEYPDDYTDGTDAVCVKDHAVISV
jgi:hypothetical protein